MKPTRNEAISLEQKSTEVRRHLVEMMHYSKSSHIGTCLSIVEILTTLYFRVLKVDPQNPTHVHRDKFILSKAHGSAALYAVLAEAGFFGREVLKKYYIDGGVLPGHLDRLAVPGVETSGGSLGHGLSLGIGMAISNLHDKNPGRIFVLLGDGECNEGSVWEAAMLAGHLKLSNLTVMIDFNKIQSLGNTNEVINQSNLVDRWRTFGWDSFEADGHSTSEIEAAFKRTATGPKCIVFNTVKGKGVSFMENKLLWHYRSPNDQERSQALNELSINSEQRT